MKNFPTFYKSISCFKVVIDNNKQPNNI